MSQPPPRHPLIVRLDAWFLHGLRRRTELIGALSRRVAAPMLALVGFFMLGSLGYYVIGIFAGEQWSFLDCMFMTSITLSTVGFEDPLGASHFAVGKIYTMGLIVGGMGATAYSISALTAFIVEGYIGKLFREARLENEIQQMKGHTIICGAGTTGIHVIEEHLAHDVPIVVIEKDEAHLQTLIEEHPGVLHFEGDATNEEILEQAGIMRAQSLVAVLGNDKDNIFLVVSARFMRPDLRIVARCSDHDAVGKFRAAGATHVVSPAYIGGLRIASQVIRPHVVDFLDDMLRSNDGARVSECLIRANTEFSNRSIADSKIRERVGLQIVAVRPPDVKEFLYSPDPSFVLVPGAVIVVIGPIEKVKMLEDLVGLHPDAPRGVS